MRGQQQIGERTHLRGSVMKAKLNKGTNEFQFFADFYNYLSDHYIPENTEEYYDSMIHKADELLDKYKQCDFFPLAKGLLLVVAVYMSDIKGKGKTKGHWTISFRE